MPVFGNSYAPSFFQHAFPGKLASQADISVDIVQKAHPAARGPMSTRVIENIVSKVEMFEMIYVTKEDMKSVKFSLIYFYLRKILFCVPVWYLRSPLENSHFFLNSCLSLLVLSKNMFHYNSVSHFHVAETSRNTKCKPTDNRHSLFLLNHNVSVDPGRPCLSAFTTISSQTTTHEACFPGLKF